MHGCSWQIKVGVGGGPVAAVRSEAHFWLCCLFLQAYHCNEVQKYSGENWRQSQSPSISEWINELQHIHKWTTTQK